MITLSSCGSTKVTVSQDSKPTLNLSKPAPLKMRKIEWAVPTDTGLYCLDEKSFDNLTKNTVDIQNRLILDRTIIEKYKQFYESKYDRL